MSIRVIGAGLPRTGTMSMKIALQDLGFDACYHMIDLLRHPEEVTYWEAAGRGEDVDWETLFTGYQSTIDYPGCRYYQQLMQLYPESKIILTVRDPNDWFESIQATLYQAQKKVFGDGSGEPAPLGVPGDHQLLTRVMRMLRHDMWEGDFQGRYEDREFIVDFFNRHTTAVKENVPADRLLVFEVAQGWGPLCEFLEVPVPQDKPFPRLNDREEFMNRINSGSLDK